VCKEVIPGDSACGKLQQQLDRIRERQKKREADMAKKMFG